MSKPMELNIKALRAACAPDTIRWTAHALKRLMQRGISQADMEQAIKTGEIIEQYPDDYPYPSCLILGKDVAGDPLHAVCGLGGGEVWMITAYHPSPSEWEANLKTRKEPQE